VIGERFKEDVTFNFTVLFGTNVTDGIGVKVRVCMALVETTKSEVFEAIWLVASVLRKAVLVSNVTSNVPGGPCGPVGPCGPCGPVTSI